MGLQFSKILLLLCILSILSFGFGFREVRAHSLQGRILIETENDTQSALTIRTERVDPLNDLKKYEGGYNITNKHYWGSVIFTGKFGYIIAAAWLILGILYIVIVLVTDLCCRKQRKKIDRFPGTKKNYVWPIVFGTLLTLLAIVASGVALGGSTRFNARAKTVKNIIMGAANNASETIYAVTNSVKALQSNPQIFSSIDGSNRLNSTLHRLDGEADNIQSKALKSMRLLNKGLKIMNVVTIATVASALSFQNNSSFSRGASRGLKMDVARGYLEMQTVCHFREVVPDVEKVIWVSEVIDPDAPIYDGPQNGNYKLCDIVDGDFVIWPVFH